MTTGPKPIDPRDTDAKLSLQQRQQLSALLDGELAPDQARFLLRRLGHDADLAGRWQRWQLAGDVLRGRPVMALAGGTDGFAQGVARAVATSGGARAPGFVLRWRHGVGLAAAASVAALALFVSRPVSMDSELPAPATASRPSGAPAPRSTMPRPALLQPAVPAPPEPALEASVPQFAEAAPPVVTSDAASRDPGRIAAAPQPARRADADAPPRTLDGDGPAIVLAGDDRPFATPTEPQARPWPRAALRDGVDPLTVGFSEAPPGAPSFYPFEPQLPSGEGDSERSP